MEGLRKEGRGESQREGSPAQRPMWRESGGREEGSEGQRLAGKLQSSERGAIEGPHVPEAMCSTEAKIPEEEEEEEHPPPPRQREEEMKEISSGVWPGGQWTTQPLKFFHFSGNRI